MGTPHQDGYGEVGITRQGIESKGSKYRAFLGIINTLESTARVHGTKTFIIVRRRHADRRIA